MDDGYRGGNTPRGGDWGSSSRVGQGVSDALRNAYRGKMQDLPEEFSRLLSKLR